PSVRSTAMADKDQQKVWNSVRSAQESVAVAAGGPVAAEIHGTSSYARVMDNSEVKKQVDAIAEPVQRDYQGLVRELRARNAVGVVAAVGGKIIWADVFASSALLEKYWPTAGAILCRRGVYRPHRILRQAELTRCAGFSRQP